MTSLAVAAEASAERPRRAVVGRTREWSGGVVEFKVPPRAKPGFAMEGDARIDYVHFTLGVPGGVVNVFIHTKEPSRYIGKSVVADAELHRKVLAGGQAYLHIDLHPCDDKPSHWVSVQPQQEGKKYPDGAVVFKTPAPLEGMIVITARQAPQPARGGDRPKQKR